MSLESGIGRRFDVKQFYCPRAATVILQVLLVKTIGGKAHRSIDDCFASWLTLIQEREAPRPKWRSCTSFPSNAVGLGSVRRIHFNGELRMCDTLQVSALRACKQHLHCTVEPHPVRENVARPPLRINSRSKLENDRETSDWVPFFGGFAFEVSSTRVEGRGGLWGACCHRTCRPCLSVMLGHGAARRRDARFCLM